MDDPICAAGCVLRQRRGLHTYDAEGMQAVLKSFSTRILQLTVAVHGCRGAVLAIWASQALLMALVLKLRVSRTLDDSDVPPASGPYRV